MWEEPPLSGKRGSGTVFFSGCVMRCAYCQNYNISHFAEGLYVTEDDLIGIFLKLSRLGAHNINLVTPSHYIRPLAETLKKAKPLLNIPIIWNSGGYESIEDLKKLEGLIDIYLPDFKYGIDALGEMYSGIKSYSEVAYSAISEMRRQQPRDIFRKGIMEKGVIVRHLILPSHLENSYKALEYISKIDKKLYVSIMGQYFPVHYAAEFPELNRRITEEEYAAVLNYFDDLGLTNGFTQKLSSAIKDYIPDFDLEILKRFMCERD